jgi:hypothetical protein
LRGRAVYVLSRYRNFDDDSEHDGAFSSSQAMRSNGTLSIEVATASVLPPIRPTPTKPSGSSPSTLQPTCCDDRIGGNSVLPCRFDCCIACTDGAGSAPRISGVPRFGKMNRMSPLDRFGSRSGENPTQQFVQLREAAHQSVKAEVETRLRENPEAIGTRALHGCFHGVA